MNKKLFFLVLALLPAVLFAQQDTSVPQKFALVIGNGAYASLSRLANPVNDANDMALALEELGFTVDKLLNGSLDQMDNAIIRLKNRLSVSTDAYGFFFYAGHGVQSGGNNYLIPVDANIPAESFLRSRSMAVQAMLDELNDAGNCLNVVVLDACRDSPFGWGRSGNRGLAVISHQPADSIIVYATSAGQQASDGSGRNGLFTSQLLVNIRRPGLEVSEVFRRTGADVAQVSGRQQIPAVYNQFFGTAYLGSGPTTDTPVAPQISYRPAPQPEKPVSQPQQRKQRDIDTQAYHLNTVGASVGSSFSAPWFIATLQGTFAPWSGSFFGLGMDLGLGSGETDIEHFSLYPFARYAFFVPFAFGGGWHAGAGAGYMYNSYTFPEPGEKSSDGFFLGEISTGIILGNGITVSYTLRTDFSTSNHKLALGYSYRFR